MIKKYIYALCIALCMPLYFVFASTPMFSVYANGDGNSVTISISNADINTAATLYYTSTLDNTIRTYPLGTTGSNGSLSGLIDGRVLGINGSQQIHVTVNGYSSSNITWPYNTNNNQSQVMFSSNNPTIAIGQYGTLTLSGGNGAYYISSNSNVSAVSLTISGNTLSYYGSGIGSSAITICSMTIATCGTTTITTNSSGSNTTLVLSSGNTTNLGVGQSSTVQISGANAPYSITLTSGNGSNGTITGNILTINATQLGTSVFNICGSNNVCSQLSVNVVSQTNQTSLNYTLGLAISEVLKVTLSGGSGSYYLQSQLSSPIMTSLNSNVLTVMGVNYGQAVVTVCQNNGTNCLPINFIVDRAASVNDTTTNNGTGGSYAFTDDLWLGLDSDGVRELQNFLTTTGYFNGTATGYFGAITQDAVKRFQTANGVRATGYVGPLTRDVINSN